MGVITVRSAAIACTLFLGLLWAAFVVATPRSTVSVGGPLVMGGRAQRNIARTLR